MDLMKTLLFSVMMIVLSGCGGYDGPEVGADQGTQGVQVTATVPYAHETIQDIIDRGDPPPQGDRIAPLHRIE